MNAGDQVAWASQNGFYVHQRAGYLVFGAEIDTDALNAIAAGHEWADAPFHQTAQYDYIHAMRNQNQTVDQAREASNNFVRNAASLALSAKQKGNMHDAYFWFGVALHTMQDATSPAHRGFQLWTGHETDRQKATHVGKEMLLPSPNSDLFRVTRQAWEAFQTGNLNGFQVR